MDYICITCNKIVSHQERFHLDDKSFCSISCLKPYRDQITNQENKKREKQNFNKRYTKFNSGGSY